MGMVRFDDARRRKRMTSPPGCFSSRSIFLLFLVKWTFWGALQPPQTGRSRAGIRFCIEEFSNLVRMEGAWMVPGQAPLLASLPSSFLLRLSLSCPLFSFRDPLDPVEAVHPTCEGSARTPARINQPVNVRIFVPVLPPSSPSRSLAYLCPIAGKLAPFSALPSPLERTSQGLNGAILCLIAPAPP